jgi:hypothetical protein
VHGDPFGGHDVTVDHAGLLLPMPRKLPVTASLSGESAVAHVDAPPTRIASSPERDATALMPTLTRMMWLARSFVNRYVDFCSTRLLTSAFEGVWLT